MSATLAYHTLLLKIPSASKNTGSGSYRIPGTFFLHYHTTPDKVFMGTTRSTRYVGSHPILQGTSLNWAPPDAPEFRMSRSLVRSSAKAGKRWIVCSKESIGIKIAYSVSLNYCTVLYCCTSMSTTRRGASSHTVVRRSVVQRGVHPIQYRCTRAFKLSARQHTMHVLYEFSRKGRCHLLQCKAICTYVCICSVLCVQIDMQPLEPQQ